MPFETEWKYFNIFFLILYEKQCFHDNLQIFKYYIAIEKLFYKDN